MTSPHPTVSVVVPCYNYARYLPQAVASILSQERGQEEQGQEQIGLEIIIVDDASTDDSAAVAHSLAASDPRIRVLAHESNRGAVPSYNEGLAEVTGDYVVLLSADDMLAPGSLGRAVALMERHSDVGLVYGYAPEFTTDPPAVTDARARWSIWDGEKWIARMCTRGTNLIVNPEAILRRSVFDELVGYKTELPQTCDMDMWMRAATLAKVGRVNGPPQGFYRVHDANMHLTMFQGLLTEMRARRDTFVLFFDREGNGLPSASRLRKRALKAIAVEAVREARIALSSGTSPDADPEAIATATGYAELALETWPAIATTSLWRQYQQRRNRPASAIRRYTETQTHQVKGALRWRRWRRFGT